MARNLRPGPDWVPAVVVERLGPLSYLVERSDRMLWKRHIDLLRELTVRNSSHSNSEFQEDSNPQDFDHISAMPLTEVPAETPPVVTSPEEQAVPTPESRNTQVHQSCH